MGLLRPHRAVAPAPRAPTDARGHHARPRPRILRLFSAVAKCQTRLSYERPESTGSKIMFSLSSVILFNMIGVDSCVFLIFTTRFGLKTRLNGVKSIRFEKS
jgi:hypothetical protein